MELNKLVDQIKIKKSFLCLGLDSDLSKIPQFLLKESDPIFSFNKALIDALSDLIVAVKINTAFYEVNGVEGWNSLGVESFFEVCDDLSQGFRCFDRLKR